MPPPSVYLIIDRLEIPAIPPNIKKTVEQFIKVQATCLPSYHVLETHGGWYYNDGRIASLIGEMKECFYNVYEQLPCQLKPFYGFATMEDYALPLQHAWLVDDAGNVVEHTPGWNTPTWYFGIHVPEELVREVCELSTPAGQDVLFAFQWYQDKDKFLTVVREANSVNNGLHYEVGAGSRNTET